MAMSRVKITLAKHILVGNKKVIVKKVQPFFSLIKDSIVEATAVNLRIIAHVSRDMLIDKIMADPIFSDRRIVYRRQGNQNRNRQKKDYEIPESKAGKHNEPDPLRGQQRKVVFIPARVGKRNPYSLRPFNHVPLNKKYLQEKIDDSKDPRRMIATGEYLRGIVVRRGYQKGKGVYYQVRMAHRKHKDSGMWLNTLAGVLEFGSKGSKIKMRDGSYRIVSIPARPHWRPVIRRLRYIMDDVAQDVNARMLKEILERI